MIALLFQLLALSIERPSPGPQPQSWAQIASNTGRTGRLMCAAGDVWFQVDGMPLRRVNEWTDATQDEPRLCPVKGGWFASWNNRRDNTPPPFAPNSYYMVVMAQRFAIDGTPIGHNFVVPVETDAWSTWRPMIAVQGNTVAFLYSYRLNNMAAFRLYDLATNAWLTGDMPISTSSLGGEQDPDGVFLPSGLLHIVWKSSHDAWNTLHDELEQRDFDGLTGIPTVAQTRLVALGLHGDQREPRVGLGDSGEPLTVFEDVAGVWLLAGSGMSPVLLGPGHLPELAGSHVVYERDGNVYEWPCGQQLNTLSIDSSARPSACMTPGGALLVGWQGSGQAWARAFKVTP